MQRILIPLIFTWILTGCGELDVPKSAYEVIPGRDQQLYYRVRVPHGWQRIRKEGSLEDTTLPLCEFLVEQNIRITLHNFPDLKVPPQAQIARWKQQLNPLSDFIITPQAFSGFVGLKCEASGLIEGKPTKLLGWSLQLAPEFTHAKGQTGADVTIKIVGPMESVEQNLKELEQFARSFELIEDL